MNLLRRERAARRYDHLAILPIEIHSLDRAIVQARNSHVRPVDVTRFGIDDDAIGVTAIGDDGLSVRAIRVHRMNTAAA